MNNIEYIYQQLEKSDVSLIGYTFKSERIKYEFISKLPHVNVDLLQPQRGEINSSFSIRQYLRDHKINQVLDDQTYSNKEFNWIVIDTNSILLDKLEPTRANRIYEFVSKLRSEALEFQDKLRILITSPMYKSNKKLDINNFRGGSRPLYLADFAFVILDKDKKVNIIKNRYDHLKEYELDISGLEKYDYICEKELLS